MADENGKSAGPSHQALSVSEGKDGKSYFKEIGAAFAHKDGQGFNIELQALPVNGRIVLRSPQDRLKDAKDGGGKEKSSQGRERD